MQSPDPKRSTHPSDSRWKWTVVQLVLIPPTECAGQGEELVPGWRTLSKTMSVRNGGFQNLPLLPPLLPPPPPLLLDDLEILDLEVVVRK